MQIFWFSDLTPNEISQVVTRKPHEYLYLRMFIEPFYIKVKSVKNLNDQDETGEFNKLEKSHMMAVPLKSKLYNIKRKR